MLLCAVTNSSQDRRYEKNKFSDILPTPDNYRICPNQLTVFYFGATSCGPCNRPEVIESIDKLRAEFDSVHPEYDTKFVMVVFDEDIETGLDFIKKYDYWDEVSIGSRYDNELSLDNLNKAEIPALPHILIYEETFEKVGDWGIEVRKKQNIS